MLQKPHTTVLAVALAAGLLSAGCNSVAATAVATAPAVGTRWVVMVDGSQSVCAAGGSQAAFWADAAGRLVFDRVSRGDTISILRLGSASAFDAPAFEARVPIAAPGFVGADVEMKARVDTRRVKAEAAAAFKELVSRCGRERWSRLLDGLDRLPKRTTANLQVLVFTDGVESTPDFDLERVALTAETMDALAGRVLARPGWGPDRLRGARVTFVLPRFEHLDRAGADKVLLEAFWRRVLESAGARLASFDNSILAADDDQQS